MDPTGERASAPAFEDGLGSRHAVDGGEEPLEVLTVRPELATAASFEFAVRERATRLASFRRACYSHVRSVERVDALGPMLAVVSERIIGTRLSRILAVAETNHIVLEIDAALCLIRQLVQAVALLHENVPDVWHGAIAPERIIVTPQARLVIADYIFGAALRDLDFSRERYWKELRIALPAGAGAPRLDRRADVTQVGIVALALVLGRPLRDDEYPGSVADLLEHLEVATPQGREPVSSGLKNWIVRTLQIDPRGSFGSAIEAGAELEMVLSESEYTAAPAALQAFVTRCDSAGSTAGPAAPAVPEPAVSFLSEVTLDTLLATPPAKAERAVTAPAPAPMAVRFESAVPAPVPQAATAAVPRILSGVTIRERDNDGVAARTQGSSTARTWSPRVVIGAAVVLIAMTSGVTLATRQLFNRRAEVVSGTLNVTTSTAGVLVVIDGYTRGRTPLTTDLKAGDHVVELVTDHERRKIPVKMVPGGSVSQFVEVASAAVKTGKVFVRTEPAGARVTVDGSFFGSAPITVDGLTPGVHSVRVGDEPNAVVQKVTIEGGVTASLVVPLGAAPGTPSPGWISVTAPVEVQLFEDGNLVGSSRTSRIMMPAGKHQLQIVNESVGYKLSQSVQVEPGSVAAIKPAWPKSAIALNALPWAEVFIDGDKVGDTPLGSVSLPVGPHEVVFRHPQLGEQRHQIMVTLNGSARLSVDLRKK